MNGKTFLATIGAHHGEASLARAEYDGKGSWTVDFLMDDTNVRCLAADPHQDDNVYAGTQGNGVLRSIDGGQTWEQQDIPLNLGAIYLSHDGRFLTVTELGGARTINILENQFDVDE